MLPIVGGDVPSFQHCTIPEIHMLRMNVPALWRSCGLKAITYMVLVTTGLAACSDDVFQPAEADREARPQFVTTTVRGNGESLIQIDLEDAKVSNDPQRGMEGVVGFQSDFNSAYPFEKHALDRFNEFVTEPARTDPNQNHTSVPFPTVPCKPTLYP